MSIPAEKQFSMQVAELGFTYQQAPEGNYIRSPEGSPEGVRGWHLHQQDDRWVLYVRDVPQIVFHPHEALKFLQKQAQTPTTPQRSPQQSPPKSQPVHPR
jgi:hypothetical protein